MTSNVALTSKNEPLRSLKFAMGAGMRKITFEDSGDIVRVVIQMRDEPHEWYYLDPREVTQLYAFLGECLGNKPHESETSEQQPAVALLREVLENISTVRPLEHFPAVTALAYCREKAIEALNATRAFQEVIVGEYEANGKLNLASSALPEGTKLYARLPIAPTQKALEGQS